MTWLRNLRDRVACFLGLVDPDWFEDQEEIAQIRDDIVEISAQFQVVSREAARLRRVNQDVTADRDWLQLVVVDLRGQLLAAEAELEANRSSK